jgi:hypothetical protein
MARLHLFEQGVGVLTIFFVISALPGLQDQWEWLESECYVISHNRTCIDAERKKAARCFLFICLRVHVIESSIFLADTRFFVSSVAPIGLAW